MITDSPRRNGNDTSVDPVARLVRVAVVGALSLLLGATMPQEQQWRSLFNGEDLSGWTVKVAGHDLGEDPLHTFRIQDGLLTVSYERYDTFGERFAHLFYDEPFSSYVLRIEYRFVGEQVEGGPDWAVKNSGVMFHSQSPESMARDQDFPISLEAQFLGGNGTDERPTASLCTPGTHVVMDGELTERHCTNARAPTYHGKEWVTVDLIIRGGTSITHVIDGDTVLAYERPVVGGGVVNSYDEAAKNDGELLTAGYIALQSESHPIQFRRVLLRPLPGGS